MAHSAGIVTHIPILKKMAVHVILKQPSSTTSPSTPAGSLHCAFPSTLETSVVQFNIFNSKAKNIYFAIVLPGSSTDQLPQRGTIYENKGEFIAQISYKQDLVVNPNFMIYP